MTFAQFMSVTKAAALAQFQIAQVSSSDYCKRKGTELVERRPNYYFFVCFRNESVSKGKVCLVLFVLTVSSVDSLYSTKTNKLCVKPKFWCDVPNCWSNKDLTFGELAPPGVHSK